MMQILCLYSTWHGTVPEVLKKTVGLLRSIEADDRGSDDREEITARFFDIERDGTPIPTPEGYDCVLYGTSVHDDTLPEDMKQLLADHTAAYPDIAYGLMICSIKGDERTRQVLEREVPESVRAHIGAVGLMGGRIIKEKLSFFERRILNQITFQETRMQTLDDIKVHKFTALIDRILRESLTAKRRRETPAKVHYKARKTPGPAAADRQEAAKTHS